MNCIFHQVRSIKSRSAVHSLVVMVTCTGSTDISQMSQQLLIDDTLKFPSAVCPTTQTVGLLIKAKCWMWTELGRVSQGFFLVRHSFSSELHSLMRRHDVMHLSGAVRLLLLCVSDGHCEPLEQNKKISETRTLYLNNSQLPVQINELLFA